MAFDPNKITFFARTDARGKDVQFGIKAKDRQRHMYIIGKTGMGKSTLLENMAVQDIQNGEGMAFIDPHGSTAETLLNYIPAHRINDVMYFAPSDTDNPVSFNIMEDVGPDKRHLVVSGLMSVFKKIFVDAWSARMEYILSNTILALLEYPDSTLLGVNRMLSDKDYRKLVVDNVKDPGVRSFWVDEFAKYNERYMQEAGDSIKNKIGQFTANPIIRNIIGQPKSSFDIRKMMDEKKILIMNLSKGLIGESNANLLGSMLTTRIYLAAMSRADLPPEKMRDMPNFYFYVDEFQSFANATFANILSEARKYHLNLTIAHQYIEQMEEEVRDAVFGNVGTTIAFRVGPFDAEVLETIFTPQFLAADIVNLGARQIYLSLMIDGLGSQPFSAVTLPPIAPPVTSCKEMAIAASRAQFTKTRPEVETEIHKFHEPVVVPKKAPYVSSENKPKPNGEAPKYEKRENGHSSYNTVPKTVPANNDDRAQQPVAIVKSVEQVPMHVEQVQATIPPTQHQPPMQSIPSPKPPEENVVQKSVPAPVLVPQPATPSREQAERRESPRRQNDRHEAGTKNPTPKYQNNNDRRPPNHTRPVADNKPKHSSPDELRAILRKMVQPAEIQTATTDGKEPEKNRNADALKSVIHSALATEKKNTEITEHETNNEPERITPPHAEPVKVSSQAPDESIPETPKTPSVTLPPVAPISPIAPASPPPAPLARDGGVTPKELERMMRITTNDKPPI